MIISPLSLDPISYKMKKLKNKVDILCKALHYSACTILVLMDEDMKEIFGKCVNELVDNKRTPLHKATIFRNYLAIEKLIKWGVDISIKDYKGFTAYDLAVKLKDEKALEIYDKLLEKKPDV